MIEKIIYDYLNSCMDVPVYMEKQDAMPETYVLIEKTGSSVSNYIYSATFAIQSYSTSMYKASELNEIVKEKMDDLITLPNISKSSLNSDYNFTDTQTKKYRYQAVYDIYY